jgi:hypothetical protein
MKPAAKFKAGDYVQRVNQPEFAGVVREPRWDGQVESWNYPQFRRSQWWWRLACLPVLLARWRN